MDITLKEYIDSAILALRDAMDERFIAQEKLSEAVATILEKHLNARFGALRDTNTTTAFALEKRTDERFQDNIRQIANAAVLLEKRLDAMNEFRNTLKDQASSFFTRKEHEAYLKVVDADIRELREYKAMLNGKASQTHMTITFVIACLSLLVAAVGLIHVLVK